MQPVYVFLLLITLPAVLMALSHVYALLNQDSRRECTVLLEPGVDPAEVAAEHARAYGVEVLQVYGSSVKGYRALVPVRRLRRLARDPHVSSVDSTD